MFTTSPFNRLQIFAVILIAFGLASCSDSDAQNTSSETAQSISAELPQAKGDVDMAKVLEPGPLPEKVIGSDDAPVTIVEYASMTCGACAAFHEETLPAIKKNYIDTGKARLIIREFPLDPRATAAFMLARCSDDKYVPMVDTLFAQQDKWARAQNGSQALFDIAKLAGFSLEDFNSCLTDQALLENINQEKKRGEALGVNATPTFFVGGKKYSGVLSVEAMSALIDSLQ